MTAKITEFVFVGKTFLSIERAEERQKQLKAEGYKLVSKNSKKLMYQK